MKRIFIIITSIILGSNCLLSQDKHALGVGLDYSFGPHYFSDEIDNPLFLALNVNYKFLFQKYFSVGAGFRAGGFRQSVSRGYEEFKRYDDIYKGNVYSPFVSLGLHYDLLYNSKIDAYHFIYIENNLSYDIVKLSKYVLPTNRTSKNMLSYDIKLGYQYPISKTWNLAFYIGYSTFDYSKVDSKSIDIKSSTPIKLGISANFYLK